MTTVNWKEAIIKVLRDSSEPLHYAEIADRVAKANLKYDLGATPANSVVAVISVSLKEDGPKSPFVRVARGYYALAPTNQTATFQTSPEEELKEAGFINAFGMYWRRDSVHWVRIPKILGQQQPGSDSVNMASQKGVYLLHDGRSVVYVGQAIDQPLGVRLSQHTLDRLNGRWDRFSWFGIYPVNTDGSLDVTANPKFSVKLLIVTMEALLIEGLEPPQNRKRGDDFRAVEYLQVEDPQFKKLKKAELLKEMESKL